MKFFPIALLVLLSITFVSCDSTPGGNKSIQPREFEDHGDAHGNEHHADAHGDEAKDHHEGEEHEVDAEHAAVAINSAQLLTGTKLTFTAFKTPEKIGVPGTFDSIAIVNNIQAKTAQEAFSGLEFKVNKLSHNTGDPARDKTLKDFFFSNLSGDISGTFGELKDGKAPLSLTVNNKTVQKELEYFTSEENPGKIVIQGKIDLLEDFAANIAYSAIAEACKALHNNKTWTDVELKIETDI